MAFLPIGSQRISFTRIVVRTCRFRAKRCLCRRLVTAPLGCAAGLSRRRAANGLTGSAHRADRCGKAGDNRGYRSAVVQVLRAVEWILAARAGGIRYGDDVPQDRRRACFNSAVGQNASIGFSIAWLPADLSSAFRNPRCSLRRGACPVRAPRTSPSWWGCCA